MSKVSHPSEHHRQAKCIDSGDDLFIPRRASRLDNRGNAQGRRRLHSIGEGEKSIRRQDGVPGPIARALAR